MTKVTWSRIHIKPIEREAAPRRYRWVYFDDNVLDLVDSDDMYASVSRQPDRSWHIKTSDDSWRLVLSRERIDIYPLDNGPAVAWIKLDRSLGQFPNGLLTFADGPTLRISKSWWLGKGMLKTADHEDVIALSQSRLLPEAIEVTILEPALEFVELPLIVALTGYLASAIAVGRGGVYSGGAP